MTYFLQDVAKYLFERSGGDLRDRVIVFPNRRARLFFNHFLSVMSSQPIWAPKYYTIADLVQKLSGLTLGDPLSLLFKLFKVFRDVTGSTESFDSFYYYCEMILADFDDIDKYRVEADQIYMNLSDLKSLEDYYSYLEESQIRTLKDFWEIFNTARDSQEKQEFLSLWEGLYKIYTEYNKVLSEEGIAYEGKAYRELITQLKDGTCSSPGDEKISFVGFNALNRSEELLFEFYKKQGNALFFWDFSEDYVGKKYHEAGYFLREYLKDFPPPGDFRVGEFSGKQQKLFSVAVPATLSQAKVTDFCLNLIDSGSISGPLQTAVILADEGLLIPVVNSLPDTVKNINISMGYPVTDTPAYNLIDQLANLQKRKQVKGDKLISYYSRDIMNLYQHEFIRGMVNAEDFAQFEKEVIKHNLFNIPVQKITLDDPVSLLLTQQVSGAADFITWLRKIIEEVAAFFRGIEDSGKYVLWHIEVLQHIHLLLQRFEALMNESEIELTLPTVLNLLNKVLAGVSAPFAGEPLEGLQVMGILETRTLDFKNIILLSMNEGNFPKTSHAPSFIPFSLREGFGLPTIRHQDAIFSYYFYRLLHRAENVVMVYNTKTEGIQKGEPSRYLQQLLFESQQPVEELSLVYEVGSTSIMPIRARKDEEVLRKLEKYTEGNGEDYFSPSAINTYLSCRLKFYFRYIEEIGEPKDVRETIEADTLGSILHKAMKLLYMDFRKKVVSNEDLKSLGQNKPWLDKIIDQAFNEEYFRQPEGSKSDYTGRNLIVRQVIQEYVETILSYDGLQAPFQIEELEKSYRLRFEVSEIGKKIWLGGIIDRIDLREGVLRVIDYKTGSTSLKFPDVRTLFTADSDYKLNAILQSMLYAWMIAHLTDYKVVQPSLFYVRELVNKDFDPRLINDALGKTLVLDIHTCLNEFESELGSVLSEIFNPDIGFEQTDNTDNCKYCPYASICRRQSEK